MPTNIRTLKCAYCGETATSRDHVIPVCVLRPQARRHTFHANDWLVPSCHECNLTLGAVLLLTVPDRARYLFKVYSKRWRKLIKSPVWTDYEISQLTGHFQRRVQALSIVIATANKRLDHLDLVSEMDDDYMRD